MQSIEGRARGSAIFSICAHTHASTHDSVHVFAAIEPVSVHQALQLVSRADSYLTAASGPVSHLQLHWPLCFCCKHASWVVQPLVLLCSRQRAWSCHSLTAHEVFLLSVLLFLRHAGLFHALAFCADVPLSVGSITVRNVTNAEDQSI